MVTKNEGRKIMEKIVRRWRFVEENPGLITDRLLSEQDIITKFVLPMMKALNWDPLKIREDGPEVHEKGFRERDMEGSAQEKAKKGGLPDIILRGEYSDVPLFVEVKHPQIRTDEKNHLQKYRDGDIVFLTSFRESKLIRVGKNGEKEIFEKFIARNPELYVEKFDNL